MVIGESVARWTVNQSSDVFKFSSQCRNVTVGSWASTSLPLQCSIHSTHRPLRLIRLGKCKDERGSQLEKKLMTTQKKRGRINLCFIHKLLVQNIFKDLECNTIILTESRPNLIRDNAFLPVCGRSLEAIASCSRWEQNVTLSVLPQLLWVKVTVRTPLSYSIPYKCIIRG